MPKVLISVPVTDRNKKELETVALGCDFIYTETPTEEEILGADFILGNVCCDKLCESTKLRWLQTNSAGVEPYLQEGILPKGCMLTNATGAYGPAISEHMLAMHLSLLKRLPSYRDRQAQADWQDLGPVSSIRGSTVLVLGFGDIGSEYGKLCKAMGATVIGLRRTDLSRSDCADEIYLADDLDKLLPRADVVAIALPGTAATKNMMNRRRIESMKPGAILLNVGRGTIVDTEALCDALESGRLFGAGLDVTDPEPLPKTHRLWTIPSAVITPHISGGYHLDETRERIVKIFIHNYQRLQKGQELSGTVDFSTGYRKQGAGQ